MHTQPSASPRLLHLIDEIASQNPQRELYQPVFGVDVVHDGPIQRECTTRAEMVLTTLQSHDMQNMRVLDVGTNMGFISFYLADRFARVTGVESNETLLEYCNEIRSLTGSKAEFTRLHFFRDYSTFLGKRHFDACLLFSVIHYLVGEKGIDAAKEILADIVSHFDHVIIELSTVLDYPYMPADPVGLVQDIPGYSYTLLGTSEKNQRPIYHLKRTQLHVFPGLPPISTIAYRIAYEGLSCSRIYRCKNIVIKTLPLTEYPFNCAMFGEEVSAYQVLTGQVPIPKLIAHGSTAKLAWIATELTGGTFLDHVLLERHRILPGTVATIMCKVIVVAADMLRCGLYWNDLAAHNITIKDGKIIALDFGGTRPYELHDHIAMLTWLLHDLTLGYAASYETGAYQRIQDIGSNEALFSEGRFNATDDFFPEETRWIYDTIRHQRKLYNLVNDPEAMQRIRAAGASSISL